MIVADSNLIAYLLIPGDKSKLADEVFLKDPEWAVPLICRSEIRNILALYMRHEGMTPLQARLTMEKAETLWRKREYAVPSDAVLDVSFRHGITAYDAEFVVLARQLAVPLVTFDNALRRACPQTALSAENFLKA
ncbi:MAG TPA: type II toxin-antitoxin system VapC family toxin [Kiritimatiellia bacterium]|mgnify:CR=1 FL=1|jgi:predicted nucleic acid-binding protein|nr:type II toxin-antitoxin system VapC family toxin [Lentisphaerota bacterium]HRV31623.1 type II toxin-antitoxin system VapC family toxin [Kiritimatiellia bacterium]